MGNLSSGIPKLRGYETIETILVAIQVSSDKTQKTGFLVNFLAALLYLAAVVN